MSIDYEEDIAVVVTADDLKNISNLAHDVIEGEKTVDKIEDELKAAKAKLRAVQEGTLPEAMKAVGMTSFKTTDGHSIEVKETLYASIAKKNMEEAIAWLVDNELSALVKSDVTIPFDKGEQEKMQQFLEFLEEHQVQNRIVTETVNTMSVKAAIKELLEDGVEVPLELFGAYFSRRAVVE